MKDINRYILEKQGFLVKKSQKGAVNTIFDLKKGDKFYLGVLSASGIFELEFVDFYKDNKFGTYGIQYKFIDNDEVKEYDYYKAIKEEDRFVTGFKDMSDFKDDTLFVGNYTEDDKTYNPGLYDFVIGINYNDIEEEQEAAGV